MTNDQAANQVAVLVGAEGIEQVAGGEWVDAEVVVDHNPVTSRRPDDIPAFNEALLDQIGVV